MLLYSVMEELWFYNSGKEKKKETVIQFGELEREREGVGGTT